MDLRIPLPVFPTTRLLFFLKRKRGTSLVVQELRFCQCRGCGFDSWLGIPLALWPKNQNLNRSNIVTYTIKTLKVIHIKKIFQKLKLKKKVIGKASLRKMTFRQIHKQVAQHVDTQGKSFPGRRKACVRAQCMLGV